MRKLLRLIATMLVIAIMLLTPFSTLTVMGASGVSAEDSALLKKWSQLGLIEKGVSTNELYKPIQKIDFIGFVNKVLKPTKQADINFIDVPKSSWYGKEIAKAVAAGYVVHKEKNNFYPFSNITRVEASVMVAKVFGLELNDQKLLKKITDAEKLDEEQLQYFGAVVEKGYLSEISSGRYAPLGVLKLIDAMKMLDKCIGLVVTQSGTVNKNVTGNMLINTNPVTLKGMEISGDLIIGEGVADGNVSLENVTVKGKMVIRGGGPNSVIIKSSAIAGDVIVEKYAGNVRVVAQGTTTIENTYLRSGGQLLESNLTTGKGFVNVFAEQAVAVNQIANLEGSFDSIQMTKSNINVRLAGKADKVNILENTISGFTLVSGSAETITTKASKGTIKLLSGTVNNLKIEQNATGNRIDLDGVAKVNKLDIAETTVVNFTKGNVETLIIEPTAEESYIDLKGNAYIKNIIANAASTITGKGIIDNLYVYADGVKVEITPSSVYIANGVVSDVNGTIIDPTKPNIAFSVPEQVSIQVGGTANIAPSSTSPSGTKLTYISSDNNIATVSDSGVITAVSIGTTKVYVTGQYTHYNPKTATVNVTVTSDNVTVPGTLEINPESGEAGTKADFELTYTAGDNMSNGTVVIKLPNGFSAYVSDTVSINGGSEINLLSSQIPNLQTLSFTNLNLTKGDKIIVYMRNRVVPAGGHYEFTTVTDADATGPKMPISGQENATFISDSLRVLIENTNYSTPEYGSQGGTTRITKLSFAGFTGATKWLIKVQDNAFTVPSFEDVLPADEYIEYTAGQDISVIAGQHLMLAAVDDSNEVKAYKDITITSAMITPYSAENLVLGTNYSTPTSGIRAKTVRITDLDLSNIAGATKWMYRVQDTATSNAYVDSKFEDAMEYTAGDDIMVTANQHILLAAVDNSGNVKAYTDIKVTANMISLPAGSLEQDSNFSAPEFGDTVGTVEIKILDKADTPDFAGINKWMYVVLGNQAVIPAKGVSTTDFERYTEGKTFVEYTAKDDITVSAGNHLLLVGVQADGTSNKILAYVDLTIEASQIRQADAIEIPDINFAPPVMGSKAGTTMFPDLNFNTSASGTTIPTDAVKFMIKVQDEALTAPLQINSILSGAINCVINQDIAINAGQHIILLATDASGRIKAYKDIVVSQAQIRPSDALKLLTPNDYSLPQAGTAVGTTKIVLSANGIPGFVKWIYVVGDSAFAIPYKGMVIPGTDYVSGGNINVSVGQHILILAVDGDGKILAYTDELISAAQIKQPQAGTLKSSSEVGAGESYNYSEPEPGQTGGTTRITTLNTLGIQGATKWLYKVVDSTAVVDVPDYNSVISGLLPYIVGDSITISDGQRLILYVADNASRIKAYKDIPISLAQIRTPSAAILAANTNYSNPAPGTAEGMTMISSLSFAGLTGVDGSWSFMYVVGDKMFNAPAKDSDASSISGVAPLTTTTQILAKPGQYILLLAVDGSGNIKAYANIYVYASAIRPFNADVIPSTSYNLTKGKSEGTTSFDKLDLIGIIDAKNWMIKVQEGPFEVPAKDVALSGSTMYTLNSDINIKTGWHILLLATDTLNRVKAYADITVTKDKIQSPYANLLTENTNYTIPEPGSAAGTTTLMLSDTGIEKAAGETVVWKYKVGTQALSIPLLEQDSSSLAEWTTYASGGDIPVSAGNYLLIVATINDKIMAYKLFTLSATQIKPVDAPLLNSSNYSGPTPGSKPGTTKLSDLKLIGVAGATKWQIKVVDTATTQTLDSVFTTPINYTSGDDIAVKANQYVVLAAVDANGKVKAYKNILITSGDINPPLANKLVSGLNYTTPKYGTVTGTTSIYVSPEGINGCDDFVVKVSNTATDIIDGQSITVVTGTGSTYSDYRIYTSGTDIAVSAGQYVTLIAIDTDNGDKALAYENIKISEANIRPGNAVLLQNPQNYTTLQPGSGVGTTKFTDLTFVGVAGATKWIVKVTDNNIAVPMINSSVEGALGYDANKDISVKEGQYVTLYAVDDTGRIKGYVCLPVLANNVRGVAPLLILDTNYSLPEPGSQLNKTKISALSLPAGATSWKYSVQDSSPTTILKDQVLSGYLPYSQGDDIQATEGQHLVLIAVDNNGGVKAYADILLTASNLRNVEITLAGTAVTLPTGEENIVAGGRTIIIKLAYGVWQDDVLSNTTKRNALFDSFAASGTEQAQWGKVLTILKNEGTAAAVMNAAKDTITITLSEATSYNITDTQFISLTIKPEAGLIKGATKAVTSLNNIKIAADVIAQISGTAVPSLGEGDIVAGNKEIIIMLTNGKFALDVASDADKRNAIFDGLTTSSSDPTMWNKVITALKAAGEAAIIRNSSSKITIKLPAVAGYDITMNEIISIVVPYKTAGGDEILVDAIKDAAVASKITIASNSTAVLSGTLITTPVSEVDILTGGKTLTIILSDGQWVTDIKTNESKRNALFSGLAASTDTTSWAKVVAALKAAGQTAIERTDNYTVTITLPAVAGYNIAANQYVTMTIPAACMIGGIANLTLSDTISIGVVATATLSGTAIASTFDETAVRAGGKTIIITLNGATWANDINDPAVKNALFDGFTADVEASEWAKVVAILKGSSIAKTSATVITITMPAVPDYDISSLKQIISVKIPTAAVIGTIFDVQSTNTMTINYTAPTAAKVVEVRGASNGYKLGDVIQIKVIFDTAVDVTGTPTLTLETGAIDGTAYYKSGSGTKELLFEYTVKAGDINKDLDYVATNSLTVLGASIVNSGTNVNAVTTLPKPGASSIGSLSYTSNILVDAVPPKLATGYPKAGTKTEQTANVIVKFDKVSNVYYVTVLDDITNSVPTAEQVMNGLDAAGTAVATGMLGIANVTENIEGTLTITNLSAYTDYTVYMVAVDSLGNIGAVTAFNFKTADTTAPVFITGYPQQELPTSDNLISILIKANEDGNAYLIALPAGSTQPTSAQVKAFRNANDVTVAANLRATAAITKDIEAKLTITGLTVSTHYDIYVVCVDASGNIINTPAMVAAETSKLNMDNVVVDLAQSAILNTTTQMEYSFDSIIWKPCTATKTSITYDDNAQMIAVYMREAANTSNMRTPIILTRADDSIINTSLIDYDIAAGKIINNSTIDMQYRINGSPWNKINASSTVTNVVFEQGNLDVRIAATSPTATTDSELPSAPKTVVNIPVPMPAPGLIYNDTTNTISGLLITHEYSINGGPWINGLVEGDFAGTKKVLIREKATKLKLASAAQVIQFTACALKVVASPAAADDTLNKNFVTIEFEENTNKPALSVAYLKDNFQVGTWDASGNRLTTSDWGSDIDSVSWNTAGNIITIIYNSMADSTLKIGDEVRLLSTAGIKNAANTSANYTSTGKLTGSFHTVPVIESIKAVNTNNDIGFSNGERLVITFDQPTNSPAITAADIANYLILTDSTGKIAKSWGSNILVEWIDYSDPVNTDADPTNNVASDRVLTITFNDITQTGVTVGDKIAVSPTWGLTDADGTTDVCNSSAIIGGSFTSVPKVISVVMANGGTASKVDAGDTIKITFDQATNAPEILASNLIKNFTLVASDGKTVHSWGVQPAANITWSADKKTLTIKLTNMTGITVKTGDKITILAAAGIKSADGGTASCEVSGITITGSY
ncbi:S-layer homology domain-containing protein [Ruminiclostridium herbifermentans]|uniref:S-layer homology domain-containing protein n=1 Tax=Ruminiclostridium herbifermentans TaxID=2488810 RepID=A0A4U7JG05_9FIRM|nr:BslA/BslB family hydrophobin [Ruminiclostridium herbifermentans]QNU66647.1 S-layer homology domain-containing protein [Ruminiclostridium herbifermentans]